MSEGFDVTKEDLVPEVIEAESETIDYSFYLSQVSPSKTDAVSTKLKNSDEKAVDRNLTTDVTSLEKRLKQVVIEAKKEFLLLWNTEVEARLQERAIDSILESEKIPSLDLSKIDEVPKPTLEATKQELPIVAPARPQSKKKKSTKGERKIQTLREKRDKYIDTDAIKGSKLRKISSFDIDLIRRKEEINKNQKYTPKKKKLLRKIVSWKEGTVFPTREIIIADLNKFFAIPFLERNSSHTNDLLAFEKVNGKDVLIGGSIEKLVSKLADTGLQDVDFIKEFLYSYRILIGPMKLLSMLIDRFNLTPPDGASQMDVEFQTKFSGAVKLRVINVLKKWLTSHYYDFLEEKRLFNRLNRFIEEQVAPFGTRWSEQLKLIIQQRHTIPYALKANSSLDMIEVTMRRPDSGLPFKRLNFKKEYYNMCFWGYDFEAWLALKLEITPTVAVEIANRMLNETIITVLDPKEKGEFKKDKIYKLPNKPVVTTPKANVPPVIPDSTIKFIDIDPIECARQLTLIMQDIFLRITARELFEVVRMKACKGYLSPWTDLMVKRSDQLHRWVASEIVSVASVEGRVDLIKRFLKIATYCYKQHDFCNASAIVKGLSHPAVEGLSKTWKTLPKKKAKQFADLKNDLSRPVMVQTMKTVELPLVPDIAYYIHELIEIGKQPDNLDNGLINFKKCRAQAVIFEEFERSRSGAKLYFKPIQRYIDFLNEEWVILDEPDLHTASLRIEPRNSTVKK